MRTTSVLGLLFVGLVLNCGGATDPNAEELPGGGGKAATHSGGAGHKTGGAGHYTGGHPANEAGGSAGQSSGGSAGKVGGAGGGMGGKGGNHEGGGGGSAGAGRGGSRDGGAGLGGTKVDGGVGGPTVQDAGWDRSTYVDVGIADVPSPDVSTADVSIADVSTADVSTPDVSPADVWADVVTPDELRMLVAGHTYEFTRNREHIPNDASTMPSSWFFPESEYAPIVPGEAVYTLTFSSDASTLALTTIHPDSGIVTGCSPTCAFTREDLNVSPVSPAIYFVTGNIGGTTGHVLVWLTGAGLQAEVQAGPSDASSIDYNWRGPLAQE